MTLPIATSRAQQPTPVGTNENLPLDPATGWLGVSGSVSSTDTPANVIYTSAAPERLSVIPATALPSLLVAIYSRLISTAAARYIQIFNVLPVSGVTVPLLVSYQLINPGGILEFIPPNGVDYSAGYWVATSITQDVYTDPGADEMITVAYGT